MPAGRFPVAARVRIPRNRPRAGPGGLAWRYRVVVVVDETSVVVVVVVVGGGGHGVQMLPPPSTTAPPSAMHVVASEAMRAVDIVQSAAVSQASVAVAP